MTCWARGGEESKERSAMGRALGHEKGRNDTREEEEMNEQCELPSVQLHSRECWRSKLCWR